MKRLRRLMLVFCLMFCFTGSINAFALDSLVEGGSEETAGGTGDEAFDSVTDYMRGYTAVTKDDMEKASALTGTFGRLVGTLSGVIIMLTTMFLFLTTALDCMCIAVPFTRRWLLPEQQPQAGMGGMGGMGGMQQPVQSTRKLVSDECIAALSVAQAGGSPQQGGMGGMGMGGMGMGGMGMGGMGGMGGMNAQGAQPQTSTKSVIMMYLKKRMFFLIIFAVASTILMSSILMDCGLNLAQLLYKLLNMLNGQISNVDI